MKIALISIGSELLTGKTVNTNAAFIGDQLLQAGYKVTFAQTISDDAETIARALSVACAEADFVITTGGLGPTGDDITKEAVARHFAVGMEHHPDIEKMLNERFPFLPDNAHQATYPASATLFPNTHGTALGFVLHKKVASLPGVPSQMKQIFQEGLLPYIKTSFPSEFFARSLYLTGGIESDFDPTIRAIETSLSGIEIGICPSWGRLSIYCLGVDEKNVIEAHRLLKEAFAECIYSEQSSDISLAVHSAMLAKGITLGCAESCTGGALSSPLTRHSGASAYFMGSLVTYSNAAKVDVLHVDEHVLSTCGAVSEEVACQMAQGALNVLQSDLAVATTGVAGPTGGTDEKPVGTVWIALAERSGHVETRKLTRKGSRETIIEHSAHVALEMIWRKCQ